MQTCLGLLESKQTPLCNVIPVTLGPVPLHLLKEAADGEQSQGVSKDQQNTTPSRGDRNQEERLQPGVDASGPAGSGQAKLPDRAGDVCPLAFGVLVLGWPMSQRVGTWVVLPRPNPVIWANSLPAKGHGPVLAGPGKGHQAQGVVWWRIPQFLSPSNWRSQEFIWGRFGSNFGQPNKEGFFQPGWGLDWSGAQLVGPGIIRRVPKGPKVVGDRLGG